MSGVKLFYQPGDDQADGRMRMIWPDGRSQWANDPNMMFKNTVDWSYPCWSHCTGIMDDEYCGKNKTQKDAIQAMRRYDEREGLPKAWYLGEI